MSRKYDKNNIFAKIIRGELGSDKVFENEFVLIIKDLFPKAPHHLLALPKGEYMNLTNFTENASNIELVEYFKAINTVVKNLGLDKTGYRTISNSGNDSCQEVEHFHTHILGGKKLSMPH